MTKPLLADTSFLVNFFNGNKLTRQILDGRTIWISSITEIEILSSPKLSMQQRKLIKDFLSEIQILELVKPVREKAIQFRVNHSLGLADSIIAASAWHLTYPFYTYDFDFKKLEEFIDVTILETKKK